MLKKVLTFFVTSALLLAIGPTAFAGLLESPKATNELPAGAGVAGPLSFVVTYDPSLTTGSELGQTIRENRGQSRVYTQFPVVGVLGDARAIAAVEATRGVTLLEPDYPIEMLLNAGPHTIGADRVRASVDAGGLGISGENVTVGVIDSGTDATHPDLAPRMNRNVKVAVTWLLRCNDDPCEGQTIPEPIDMTDQNADTTSGHGTHVSGIIAGEGTASGGIYTGVAPGAEINSVGVGDHASILWSLDGFEFLLKHADEDNLVVINNSWGPVRTNATTDSRPAGGAARTAIETAMSRGISVVFAAGNDGCSETGNSRTNPYALIPGVIGVASSLRDGQGISSFSSCGRTTDTAHDPTVTAPGSDIFSARGGPALYVDPLLQTYGEKYTQAGGTSMAAPHVAGVVAMIQSGRQSKGLPKLSPAEIKSLLQGTANPIEGVPTRAQGAGMVDAADAVATAISSPAPAKIRACPIVQDPQDDATRVLNNTPLPSTPALDLVSGTLGTYGSELVATLNVKDLVLDDPATGAGLFYEYSFIGPGPDNTTRSYYLSADYGKELGETRFRLGHFDPTRTILATATGTFDVEKDTINIRVPVKDTTKEATYDLSGATLHTLSATSRRDGVLVIPGADEAWATHAYVVGTTCAPPVAVDDTATVRRQRSVTIPVLANDFDIDGGTLSVVSAASSPNGEAVINSDGTITYTPRNGFGGTDSFSYTITDGQGGFDTADVVVSVTNR